MQLDAYDKNTLAPLFDKGVNHSTAGNSILGFGTSLANNYTNGSRMFRLGVTGNVTDVQILGTAINNSSANIDPAPFLSMDSTRPIRKVRYDTDSVNSMVSMWNPRINRQETSTRADSQGDAFFTSACLRLNPTDIGSSLPVQNVDYTVYANDNFTQRRLAPLFYPVYLNPTTGNLVCIPFATTSDIGTTGGNQMDQRTPGTTYGYRLTGYFTTNPTFESQGNSILNTVSQFLGVDSGGRVLFFQTGVVNDYTHNVIRYTDSNNTAAVLSTNTAAPTATGTSAGGNRGTSYGQQMPKYSSTTFTDPTTANTKAWYTPYFDVNGKYHPMYYQWNTSTDTFTRNTDITMNWGAQTQQSNVWENDSIGASSMDVRWGNQRLVWNDTWTVDIGGGTINRYLIMGQFHGNGAAYDPFPKQRTFVTFLMNPSNPKILTYHSHFTVPTTAKNIIYFNAEKTQMGLIGESSLYVYAFNNGTGWSLTGTVPYRFSSVGLDSLGRIWALSEGSTGYGQLHLITVNVPVTIAVTANNTEFNYTGSNINTSVTLNAYNTVGARIAVSVKLVIDGGSMTFTGSNLTTTVTSSASAGTTIPVIITGSGIANIIASVVL